MSLSGKPENEGETHSTDRKRVQVERSGSPTPSGVSMKSESSMDYPFNLKGESTGDQRVQVERSGSPTPSGVSMKSDSSMDYPFNLKGDSTGDQRVQVERSGSPAPSCLSVKSESSMDYPFNLKGESTGDQRVQVERSGSPTPSYVSVKSESSMDYPFNLKGDSTGDQRIQVERSGSPAHSYVSMKSESSMDYPFNLKGESTGDQRIHQSLDSSCFDDKTSQLFFPKQSLLRTLMKLNKDEKLKLFENHLSQDCPECFESLSEDPCAVDKFMMMSELLKSHKIHDYPECIEREPEDPEALYIVEKMLETCGSERSLKITLRILRNMKEKDLANSLEREQRNEFVKRAQQALKTHLKRKFECIYDGLNHPALLNEIYTDLYITEGGSEGVNDEHEIRQIETASKRQTTQETAILWNDIFKPLPGQEKPRTVLTKGIAGIGKTVSVQKFILDWVEGKANQDIDFVFTLPFRDLNLKKETAFNLMQLLQHYFPQLKEIKTFEGDEVKVLFIFDGLDECRLPLNFQSNKICCDMTKVLSVDVLLTNLIKGNLFPSALLWITSRPAAANQIPLECVHQVTEVRGFSDPQKEEYFRKRIRDEKQASRIISHIRSSRSLYIMCHIPVFCWISAAVLETMLGETESGDLPRTLTEMYTHFLLIQTHVKNQKYHGTIGTNPKKMSESDREIILKLGQLAFVQLVKGNLIFYEEDLRESGIDVTEASVYSGVCTEIFKEEYGLYQEKVFCFVHLSIQEYLAALFAFYSCINENRNVLRAEESKPHSDRVQMSELHRSAVDQALESKNGQLDLFLRFLLGLSLDSVKTLLGELLTQTISRSSVPGLQTQTGSRSSVPGLQTQTGSRSSVPDPQTRIRSPLRGPKTQTKHRSSVSDLQTQTVRRSSVPDLQTQTGRRTPEPDAQAQTESRSENIEETVKYIKKMISEESSAERIINLFCCLSELNDNTLVEEIQNCLRSRKLLDKVLEPHQCSALAFVLLMSEEVLAEFDLKTYNTTAAGHQRLVPVVRNCRKAILNSCDLTQKSCDVVASALQSSNSTLRDLDLSYNNLGDAGVKLLCTGLMSPKCKLQRLGLISCDLTQKSCDIVASALQSSSSTLRDLDLSYNDLGDSGVKLLCAGLLSPKCKLERLGLGWCNLTEGCCGILASVLRSPHSELRDLELRDNELQNSGVRALSAGLEDPHCKLQRLGLSGCRVTQRGFDSLASALCSNPSHLRELDLSYNHPIFSKLRALLTTKLDTLTLLADCRGGHRTKPGPRKYGCQLTLDPNTVNRELSLSEGNRRVTHTLGREEQPYPDHPERFEHQPQVMCREFLYERCYWETEFSVSEEGQVDIAVAYEGIGRKKDFSDCRLGWNKNSWSLECNKRRYSVTHNKTHRQILARPSPYRRAGVCDEDDGTIREVCVYRVGVCVDRPAGTLSFYSISNSDTLTLLHRFHVQFTQRTPLCAGFYVYKSSVSLCQLQ